MHYIALFVVLLLREAQPQLTSLKPHNCLKPHRPSGQLTKLPDAAFLFFHFLTLEYYFSAREFIWCFTPPNLGSPSLYYQYSEKLLHKAAN